MERREIEKERLQHELRVCDEKLNRQVEGKNQETKIKSAHVLHQLLVPSVWSETDGLHVCVDQIHK